jgi:GNAT superfamily N-acetyltransferase
MSISYRVEPAVSDEDLNELFTAAWPGDSAARFGPVHEHSLLYLCAFDEDRLVGYVNVAWDGGIHAFLLEPTVHPDVQRRGIGTALVKHAGDIARERGAKWLHVDFQPELREFYAACGFRPTDAGLIELR